MLPLSPAALKRVAVLGPFANSVTVLLGKTYGPTAGTVLTPLQALQAALPHAQVSYNAATATEGTPTNIAKDVANCKVLHKPPGQVSAPSQRCSTLTPAPLNHVCVPP